MIAEEFQTKDILHLQSLFDLLESVTVALVHQAFPQPQRLLHHP